MSEGSIINQMTELVMFRKPIRIKGSKGQYVETFADFRKAFVKVERLGGEETVETERIVVPDSFLFTGYNYSEIDETYRINYEGSEYNILSIERFNRRLFMKVKVIRVLK